jgi:transketolase
MTNRSVREQFAQTMLEVGKEDPKLVVMVGDISHFSLQPFAKACPGRYYNVGILEPTIMSMGAGVSRAGLVPVLHTFAPFLVERAFEQLKLDFCYQQLPGNIVAIGSGFDNSNLGCSHHCYDDFALLKTLPDVRIVYPSSPVEFDTLFRQGYRGSCVTYFRVPAHSHGFDFKSSDLVLGKALVLAEGRDVTLVATGPHLRTALLARERLAPMGWDAEVVYVHTIRPLDDTLIVASVSKTRRVVVIEEHMESGGLGDDVLKRVYRIPDVQFVSASIPNRFVTGYGEYEQQCEALGLTPEGIVRRVQTELRKPAH